MTYMDKMKLSNLQVGDLVYKKNSFDGVFRVISILDCSCEWHGMGMRVSSPGVLWKNIYGEELDQWEKVECECKICVNPDHWPCEEI